MLRTIYTTWICRVYILNEEEVMNRRIHSSKKKMRAKGTKRAAQRGGRGVCERLHWRRKERKHQEQPACEPLTSLEKSIAATMTFGETGRELK
eukprot:758646-Hanusia_phi.AAC.5